MALKVLLRRTIEGVGTVGEVVKVKPGYARNFLFPKAYAALVSPDSLRQIEKDKAAEAVRERENVARRQALVEQLKDVTVTIEERAGEDGHLYGSVGAPEIVAALKKNDVNLHADQIRLEGPLKELGLYTVKFRMASEVEGELKVWVVPQVGA